MEEAVLKISKYNTAFGKMIFIRKIIYILAIFDSLYQLVSKETSMKDQITNHTSTFC